MTVTVKASLDDKQLRSSVTNLQKLYKNPKKILKPVANNQVKHARDRIRKTKKGPDGRPWRSWSYSTLKNRERKGTASRGLLFDTGQLFLTFRVRFRKLAFSITNNQRYAGYLQFGTKYMPARPFLGWGRESLKDTRKIIKEQIRKAWK